MDELDEFPMLELAPEAEEPLVAGAEGDIDALEGIAAVAEPAAEAAVAGGVDAGLLAAPAAAAEIGTAAASAALPVVGVIIAAAGLVVAGVTLLVSFMRETRRINIMVTNQSSNSSLIEFATSPYMAHGKQTGTFQGADIKPGQTGKLEFAKDLDALFGTMGAFRFATPSGQLSIAWSVPEIGETQCATSLSYSGDEEGFYDAMVAAAAVQKSSDSGGGYSASCAITGLDSNGATLMSVVFTDAPT